MSVQVDLKEQQKRQTVFAKSRRFVKFCIQGTGPLPGLGFDTGYSATVEQKKFEAVAAQMGANLHAYRQGGGDSGLQLFNSERNVRVDTLLKELDAMGFHFVGGGWHERQGKSPMNVLVFGQEGESVEIPETLVRVLDQTFRYCTLWCNLEPNGDGTLFRTDSINLNQHRGTEQFQHRGVRRLVIAGEKQGTYDLV